MPYNYPSGMIAPFESSCPEGWTRVIEWDNKFIMGSANPGNTGGSQTHSHNCSPTTFYTRSETAGLKSVGGFQDRCTTYSHAHAINLSATESSSIQNKPPYISVIFCKKE
jgi:hypothetical protein